MDRAGRKAGHLTIDEMTTVFDLVARGGSPEEARRLLRSRDRTTANRLYNVVKELESRGLDTLDPSAAQEIAEAARYSTTASYVQDIYLRWRGWKIRADQCSDYAHQELLRDRLTLLILELRPLVNSFPGVYQLSYRPEDSANRLKWLEEDGIKRLEWELAAEQQPGWALVQQHLSSGVPEVAQALALVKQSYAGYCERLLTLEGTYRKEARKQQAQTSGSMEPNDSHSYRSILAEVDQPSESESRREYQYCVFPGPVSVAFDGVVLITQAEDRTTAQHWVGLHRQWRRDIRSEHLAPLLHLRQDLQGAARLVIAGIERVEQGGPVPGRCDRPA